MSRLISKQRTNIKPSKILLRAAKYADKCPNPIVNGYLAMRIATLMHDANEDAHYWADHYYTIMIGIPLMPRKEMVLAMLFLATIAQSVGQ